MNHHIHAQHVRLQTLAATALRDEALPERGSPPSGLIILCDGPLGELEAVLRRDRQSMTR